MTGRLLVAVLEEHEVAALRRGLDLLARRCRDDGRKMPPGLIALAAMTEKDNTGQARPAVDLGHHLGEAGPVTPLALDFETAGRMVGVSARQVRRLVDAGALPAVYVGTASPRIRLVDLEAYLADQVTPASCTTPRGVG